MAGRWISVLRRTFSLSLLWLLLFSLLSTGTALAQTEDATDEEAEEPARYGDSELIEALTTYGLLDEWIAASPVTAQASLLSVSGGGYQADRQLFLNSLELWATRTELVRTELARLEAGYTQLGLIRTAVTEVRDSLVLDDRLRGPESDTLEVISAAIDRLAGGESSEEPSRPTNLFSEGNDPLASAEGLLDRLRERAETELQSLNDSEAAFTRSGVDSFVGFEDLRLGLIDAEQLLDRGSEVARPAREESERLAASAIGQIPDLHGARMLGSSDVDGLSVVTVDAYLRAAASVACPVDWALLAGIGSIESNHGRLGGAFVGRSGQVSTAILGPLLDGGATEREAGEVDDLILTHVRAARTAVAEASLAAVGSALGQTADRRGSRASGEVDETDVDAEAVDEGNGFAVIVDTDNGRLDGNDQWDRAIGPMQFLPETWSKWATDGNGDGVADPHNLYDSTAAAARFLCDLRANRSTDPSTFLLGYNESRSYVRSVLSRAESLRATLLPLS